MHTPCPLTYLLFPLNHNGDQRQLSPKATRWHHIYFLCFASERALPELPQCCSQCEVHNWKALHHWHLISKTGIAHFFPKSNLKSGCLAWRYWWDWHCASLATCFLSTAVFCTNHPCRQRGHCCGRFGLPSLLWGLCFPQGRRILPPVHPLLHSLSEYQTTLPCPAHPLPAEVL